MSDLPFRYERFTHEAMYTMFEVLMAGEPTTYQKQCAREAFQVVTALEQQLSRFVDNSDVTRLNLAPVDEPILLGLDTFACLAQAQSLCEMTQGTLNICMGRRTAKLYDQEQENKPVVQGATEKNTEVPGWDQLVLNPDTLTATRIHPAVQVDLGAVGKGFALDMMGRTLIDWGLTRCLLHGGRSTVLSLDGPAEGKTWPVTTSHPVKREVVLGTRAMVNNALSSSSQIEQKHIIDPETGKKVSVSRAAWSCAPNGLMADGLSTAFMIMSPEEIEALCKKNPKIGAMVWDGSKGDEFKTFGAWE